MPQLKSRTYASGTIKLSEDFAKLVNNPDGSDIRFLVGGSGPTTDSKLKTHGPTEPVTLYGHSLILRYRSKYFDTMLCNDWMEKSGSVIRKPNISHITFHAVLHYIYTGNVKADDDLALLDLIAAAEEMELQELSECCQARVVEVLKSVISDEDDDDKDGNDNEPNHLPFELALHKFLIPGLTLALQHTLPDFFQELLDFTFANIETILDSTDLLAAFLDKVPSQIIKQILASDLLPLTEFEAWELALNWACRQAKVLKPMVESQLKMNVTNEDDTDVDSEAVSSGGMGVVAEGVDRPLVSAEQLKTLKANVIHLTPAIRFSLMEPEHYARITAALMFFLPVRQYIQLQHFFSKRDKSLPFEPPRSPRSPAKKSINPESKIVNDGGRWGLLRKWIFEANVISGCRSSAHLDFNLLYQASTHGFRASTFHERCNNQGPTLVLVKGTNGRIFGGVNFASWTSINTYSSSDDNFLFALKDGQPPAVFRIKQENRGNATYNHPNYGPCFGGGGDLWIYDNSNSSNSSDSNPGHTYTGRGASYSTLAGERKFAVADYEVFAVF